MKAIAIAGVNREALTASPEILRLNEEIEGLVRRATLRFSVIGFMDKEVMELCKQATIMRLRKDQVYAELLDGMSAPSSMNIILKGDVRYG
jgi:hypothetical protein